MAGRNKRRALDLEKTNGKNKVEDSADSSDDGMDDEEQDDDVVGTEIQVDFEARNLEGQDQTGVENLLRQLFSTSNNSVGELTKLLLLQKDIGSVIKQSEIPEDSDDDDSEDVFGLVSVINITEKKNEPCVEELRNLILSKAKESGNDVIYTTVNRILNDDSNHVGFVICERFINMPSRIAPNMYESLRSEIETAKSKKLPYNFTYYVILSKIYQKDSNTGAQVGGDIYVNQEDALFLKDSTTNFKFKLENKTAAAMEGDWDADVGDDELTSHRQVLIIKADKFNSVVDNLKNEL